MLKTLLVSLLAVVALALPTTVSANQTPTANGWVNTQHGWALYHGGRRTTGWHNVGYHDGVPSWVLLNNNGILQTGWTDHGGNWFFLREAAAGNTPTNGDHPGHTGVGVMLRNQVISGPSAGIYYAVNADGRMVQNAYFDGHFYAQNGRRQSGWFRAANGWRYLGRVNSELVVPATGSHIVQIGGTYAGVYLFHYGIMQQGWNERNVGGTTSWFFSLNSGILQGNRWVRSGSQWFYLNPNGRMFTGGNTVEDRLLTGLTNVNGSVSTNFYYIRPNGALQTGWFQSGNHWLRANNNGVLQTGWTQVGQNWYYTVGRGVGNVGDTAAGGVSIPPFGMVHSGTFTANAQSHLFAANGRWLGATQAGQGGPIVPPTTPGNQATPPCVPAPAVGTPTIPNPAYDPNPTIPNPAYVPGVSGVDNTDPAYGEPATLVNPNYDPNSTIPNPAYVPAVVCP